MKRLELSICLGSSCFARGNQHTVHLIKKFLQDNQLEQQVYFHGTHCFGNCEDGPVLKVGDRYLYNIDDQNIISLLTSELKSQHVKL